MAKKKPRRLFRRRNPLPKGYEGRICVQFPEGMAPKDLGDLLPDPHQPGVYWARPETIDPGGVRLRTHLSEWAENTVRRVHPIVGPLMGMSLAKFRDGFLYDQNPDSEVSIWFCIAAVLQKYKHVYEDRPGTEKAALQALLMISQSGMVPEPTLPTDVNDWLVQAYTTTREEMFRDLDEGILP